MLKNRIMKSVLRNIFAIIVGFIIGSIVNYHLFHYGFTVFPIDADINDMEALAKVFPTLSLKYYIFPFLAHALGTLIGASLAALIAASNKMKLAMGVGLAFLIVGIIAAIIIPTPLWYKILDISLGYIPMAWIGGKLITRKW